MPFRSLALLLVIALSAGAIVAASNATGNDGEKQLDVTFVIAGDLARRGGLVELVIRPDPDADPVAETREVTLTSIATVVVLNVPVDTSYTYRFRRFDEVDRGQTKRFAVGTYLQGAGLPEATILSHHADMGGDWTLDMSHRLSAAIIASAVEALYPCQTVNGAIVCDASSEIEQGLPN